MSTASELPFHGRVAYEITTEDREAWPALVKANPPTTSTKAGGQKRISMALGWRDSLNRIPRLPTIPQRVTLTSEEREWLGATVRRSDGTIGQVWALHTTRGHVWVVVNGDRWFGADVRTLTKVSEQEELS